MNMESKFICDEIFEGRLDIAAFISKDQVFFIFDDKENFVIDITPFYQRYFLKGIINKDQLEYALTNYRGGASILNNDTFEWYVNSLNIPSRSISEMKFFLEQINNYQKSLKLPTFYINLDDSLFVHSHIDRDFSEGLPCGWKYRVDMNVVDYIDKKFSYWDVKS